MLRKIANTLLLPVALACLMPLSICAQNLLPNPPQSIVGTVTVCYYSPECTYTNPLGLTPPVDAPAFEFANTGSIAITGASFAIGANKKLGLLHDTFKIGTIAPGASFVLVPGFSNDNRIHASGSFFSYSGSPLDTSDDGPDSNAVVFTFHGRVGSQAVTSGKIVTGASGGPSADGTVAFINFLGGPGNADAPCNDCVAPMVIANIVTKAPVDPLVDDVR